MNEDFRRLNADAVNTPSVFSGVAADVEIEFCLASEDPNGLPTNGITRTHTPLTPTAYLVSSNDMKSSATYGKDGWPPQSYLNIWVVGLLNSALGKSSTPDQLSSNPHLDGIVVKRQAFGTIGDVVPPFDRGRVLTHEVGHWLDLRHTWGGTSGESGCNIDDMLDDTPTQYEETDTVSNNCVFPYLNSCTDSPVDLPDMFQNYMDYGRDECKNLFTQDQKAVMRALFEPGGIRASILNSTGCCTPTTCACAAAQDLIFNTSGNVIAGTQIINGTIFVEAGGELTVTGTLRFTSNSGIVVRRGGRLHVNGGYLTRCEDTGYWDGIVVEGNKNLPQPNVFVVPGPNEAGILRSSNGAVIEWARHAISANTYNPWWDDTYRGGLVYCTDTEFLNNFRSASFMSYDFINNSRFIDCNFDITDPSASPNLGGVSIWETDGIEFNSSDFSQMTNFAIEAVDAGMSIINGCTFNSCGQGINPEVTYPFSSGAGLYVGPGGGAQNEFHLFNPQLGVMLSTPESKGNQDALIEQNRFNGGDGVWLAGLNNAVIRENVFRDNSGNMFGVYGDDTGNGTVEITCNDMLDNGIFLPVLFTGENDMSFITRNFFFSNYGNITLDGSQVATNIALLQGAPGDPARNCFTNGSAEHIWTFGTTTPFRYFHLANPCETPQNSTSAGTTNNYLKILTSPSQEESCYLFLRNPKEPPFGHGDYSDAKQLYNDLETESNNDPEDSELEYAVLQAQEQMERIAHWIISAGIDNEEFTADANLVFEEEMENTAYQRLEFGYRVRRGEFGQAEELLNNLAEEGDLTSSDGLFRAVQMINLQRLSGGEAAFTLSADQISTLEQIAAKSAPESSYARALLGLLLDRQFWPDYQLPLGVELPGTEAISTIPGLSIAPNPSSGAFTLDLGQYYAEPILVEIRDLAGRSIQSLEFQEGQRFEIDLSGQPTGLYFFEAVSEGERIGTLKAIVE
ncbi:M43 family zinc metalloprotease [Phaeodactylibacter xiamenensis]|uniref:M43 family zinc metalloprotease n=1 Tax=Phaeodactylibacter xiamenensis TaxID=1524460 RepID=UPI00069619D9|nr:M43 family zinc metalloprotease [Phaeodactylibacter xiamenensis]